MVWRSPSHSLLVFVLFCLGEEVSHTGFQSIKQPGDRGPLVLLPRRESPTDYPRLTPKDARPRPGPQLGRPALICGSPLSSCCLPLSFLGNELSVAGPLVITRM